MSRGRVETNCLICQRLTPTLHQQHVVSTRQLYLRSRSGSWDSATSLLRTAGLDSMDSPIPQEWSAFRRKNALSIRPRSTSAFQPTSGGSMMSWRIRASPSSRPNNETHAGRIGLSRATGRPRFVITISRPVSATSSISPRHFILNSVADIVRSPALRFVPIRRHVQSLQGLTDTLTRAPIVNAAPTSAQTQSPPVLRQPSPAPTVPLTLTT